MVSRRFSGESNHGDRPSTRDRRSRLRMRGEWKHVLTLSLSKGDSHCFAMWLRMRLTGY